MLPFANAAGSDKGFLESFSMDGLSVLDEQRQDSRYLSVPEYQSTIRSAQQFMRGDPLAVDLKMRLGGPQRGNPLNTSFS